jgi:hypothetical protein
MPGPTRAELNAMSSFNDITSLVIRQDPLPVLMLCTTNLFRHSSGSTGCLSLDFNREANDEPSLEQRDWHILPSFCCRVEVSVRKNTVEQSHVTDWTDGK